MFNTDMNHFITISALIVVIFQGTESRNCSSCMNYDKCAGSERVVAKLKIKDEAMYQLMRNHFCGYNYTETKVPMLCCSDFEDSVISNHENLKLLPKRCGISDGLRIINGEVTALYEFPWMALISYNTTEGSKFQCGGSIINERYILTAAHCINNNIAKVRVGEHNINLDRECMDGFCGTHKDISIENIQVHEHYSGFPILINDIALLRLAEPVEFVHPNVDPVCLPTTLHLRSKSFASATATIAGWGTTENGTQSPILRKSFIPIHTDDSCRNLFNRYTKAGEQDATTNQFCAGDFNKGSCHGDSGGPLMLPGKFNKIHRFVQYGVISHVFGQCGSPYPELFTDLRKLMGWILNNIAP